MALASMLALLAAITVDFNQTIRPMKPEHGIGQPPNSFGVCMFIREK